LLLCCILLQPLNPKRLLLEAYTSDSRCMKMWVARGFQRTSVGDMIASLIWACEQENLRLLKELDTAYNEVYDDLIAQFLFSQSCLQHDEKLSWFGFGICVVDCMVWFCGMCRCLTWDQQRSIHLQSWRFGSVLHLTLYWAPQLSML
jgi:hypothetical protein